jgi:Icc-related predicted phosphoesterase/DNA-directed RNA polymerase subunit RPC12/RpoP
MSERVNLLCVSDIHGRLEAARALVSSVDQSFAKSLDAVVVAGDIGNPQKGDTFYLVVKELEKLGKPVLYVRGNWDVNAPSGVVNEAPLVADLESLGPLELKWVTIVGHSSSLKPYKGPLKRPIVLVTHYPPFSILDRGRKAEAVQQSPHTGLPEVNYLVAYYKPAVHVFGHCHALGGVDVRHSGVVYVNVSRLDRLGRNGEVIGNYALVSIDRNGGVEVKWRFVNGEWKRCARCGRKVHLPSDWTMCRRCASRFELGFKKLDKSLERVLVTVKGSDGEQLVNDHFYIPVHTLRDEDSYNDFIDYLIVKRLKEIAAKDGGKLLPLTKDKVVEFYSEDSEAYLSFSEYLFSCREEVAGKKLCLLMRLYALDKRVKVLWKVKRGERALVEAEYVLVKEELLNGKLLEELRGSGFTPLLSSVKRVQEPSASPSNSSGFSEADGAQRLHV